MVTMKTRLLLLILAAAAPLGAADAAGDLLLTQRKADNTGNLQRNIAAGNTGAPLLSAGTGAPAFGALNLAGGTNIVSGTLPLANGGLGFTSAGTSGHVVTSNGTALAMAAPSVTAAQISDSTAAGRTLLTAADVAAQKTALSLAKADVGLGNVENTALSTWAGSTNIVTLGTVSTGTWSGTIIAPEKLGTGSSISTKYLRGDGTWQTVSGGSSAEKWDATFDGQGSVVSANVTVYRAVTATGNITAGVLVADASGNATVSITRHTPSGGALGSGTALGNLTLSSAVHSRDTTLTGWTKSVTVGDVLAIKTESATAATRLTVNLTQ